MASIRNILSDEDRERVYAYKDQIREDQVLRRDPMRLNRTQFDRYLRAKARAVVQEQMALHGDGEMAFMKARIALTLLDDAWRQEAKRINEASSA